jgi:DNA-3-methyladenine glycosylase I
MVLKASIMGDVVIGENANIKANRVEIEASVKNAQAFLAIREEFGTFDRFIWQFVGGKPRINRWRGRKQVPAKTPEAEAMSKALKARGMTFVGPTICYAFMQATGMVNDHTVGCFRYGQLE